MAIDPNIPLQTQSFDMLGMLGRGSELAQFYTKQKTDGELNRIYNESQGDLNKMLQIGQQSKLARFVVPQIQSQISAQAKAAIDQQQSLANIGKTQSEAYKNNQQGGGYALDNSGKKLGAIQGAIQQAAITGDKTQALLALSGAQRSGLMSPEDFEYQSKIINAMTPDELKQYASGIVFSNAKDPSSIMYQSANNIADNETSTSNNIRSTNASIYSTDVGAQTADKNREQDQQQFEKNHAFNEQKQYFEQNKPLGFQTGNDGYQYAVYANGKGVRVVGEDGQPIKMQTANNASTKAQIAELTGSNNAIQESIVSLNKALDLSKKGLMDGYGADLRSEFVTNLPFGLGEGGAAERTRIYQNTITNNALSSLKAVFGGNPTEGERAMLLKVQGSANEPPAVREAILNEAIRMAKSRIASNQQQMQILGSSGNVNSNQSQQNMQLNPEIMMQMP